MTVPPLKRRLSGPAFNKGRGQRSEAGGANAGADREANSRRGAVEQCREAVPSL